MDSQIYPPQTKPYQGTFRKDSSIFPPQSSHLPLVIGHRGAAAYAPENTLASIQKASDLGIRWVEIDVRLTKDGVPVILHDSKLDRTTDGSGLIAEQTYKDIRKLRCITGGTYTRERIPALDEALELICSKDIGLVLEIKPCKGQEQKTAHATLKAIETRWRGKQEKLLLASFNKASLAACKQEAPQIKRAFAPGAFYLSNWRKAANTCDAAAIIVNGTYTWPSRIRAVLHEGYPVIAYTINRPGHAERLRRWGVSGFFSDTPDILKNALEHKSGRFPPPGNGGVPQP